MLLSHWLNGIRGRLRFPSFAPKSLRRGSRRRRRQASYPSPISACVEVYEQRILLSAQPVALAFDQTPLVFDSNQGQTGANVAYVSRGADLNLSLLRNGAVLDFGQSHSAATGSRPTGLTGFSGQPPAASLAHVSLTWQGGNASPSVIGLGAVPGIAGSASRNNSSGGGAAASSVERVQYDEVYQGIDLAFYGHGKNVEFDWIVAPAVDPSQITMVYAGMDKLSLDAGGDLVISAGGQQLVQQAPVVYQVIAGAKHEVASSYRLGDGGAVRFALGSYDHGAQLVIDPVIGFSTYLGGSRNDFASDVATDSAGNTYVIGTTQSPELSGGSPLVNYLNRPFVAKFAADGKLEYMHGLGPVPKLDDSGFADSIGMQVAVGPDGLPVVSYQTWESSTFRSEEGQIFLASENRSLHIAKLSESGAPIFDTIAPVLDTLGLLYSNGFGSVHVATDDTGAIYASYDVLRPTGGGGAVEDPFITKMAADGSVEFTRHLVGIASAIAVDSQHNIYVGLTTSQKDLQVSANAYQATPAVGKFDGVASIYLAELDPTATGLIAATYLGGVGHDFVNAIAVDPNTPGRVYLAGQTVLGEFPLKNPLQTHPVPQTGEYEYSDAYIALLDLTNMKLVASTYFGGSRGDYLTGIALDRAGNVYVAGATNSRDLPLAKPLQATYTEGVGRGLFAHDLVVAKFDAELKVMLFSTYFGGSGEDFVPSLAVDRFGTIHVAATTAGSILLTDPLQDISTADFPVHHAQQPTFGGGEFGDFLGWTNLETDAVVFTIANDLTVTAQPVSAILGEPYTKRVATFTAPDPTAPVTNFTAEINWGDGTPVEAGTVQKTGNPAAPFQVAGKHIYTKPGSYPVVVTVTDVKDELKATTAYDVSQKRSNQVETAIAVDPNNPLRVFTAANDLLVNLPSILFAGDSTDGGITWTNSTDTTGALIPAAGTDALPLFGGDPRVVFDQFGNLYLTALRKDNKAIVVLLSADGGKTFRLIDTILPATGAANPADDQDPEHAAVDQPSIAVGPGDLPGTGSVWISYADINAGTVFATGARVTGLGQVGDFQLADMAKGQFGNFGNIAVGPAGQVVATWQNFGSDLTKRPPNAILVSTNPDGLKAVANFSPPVVLSPVLAVGFDYVIPPQSTRKITPDIRLAWDKSGGPYNGRLYMAYTDARSPATAPNDTDIFVRHSGDGGASWSDPVRVNDDTGGHSQFFASIAVDQSTGDVAVAWYDARNSVTDTLTQFFAAVSGDGGQTFSANVAVSAGPSNASDIGLNRGGAGNQYGDYTGLDFAHGLLYPAWTDNSAELANNSDRPQFDTAEARIAVAHVTVAPPVVIGLPFTIAEGQTFSDKVATFTDGDHSLNAADFTANIDWGDGSPTSSSLGTIERSGNSDDSFVVRGSHNYTTPGAYVIGITVTDNVHHLDPSTVSDVSQAAGTQSEGTIAIDPGDPSHLFAASNSSGKGIFGATSTDGGVTWNGRQVADGSDGLPDAAGDPKVVYDQYHNLYLTYLTAGDNKAVVVALSTDGGQTFKALQTFSDPGGTDQPSVAVGPGSGGKDGSVWVTFVLLSDSSTVAAGASVSGSNLVGSFSELKIGPGPAGAPSRNFGDVAVGPQGQVLITYQTPTGDAGPSQVFVNLDANGLQPGGFGPPILVTATNVGGLTPVPPQATRTIDAEANLAWDTTNGPHRGRLYLAYTDAPAVGSPDTNIFVRFSDDNGTTWSNPVRVNDDTGGATQFLPSVAVDPTSGDVGVSWYDARNDPGDVKTQIFAALSNNGGLTFSPNSPVSLGTSDATDPGLDASGQANQYGDYTGLVFQGGILYPAWADNSSEIILNPDLPQFDLVAGRAPTAHVTDAPLTAAPVNFSDSIGEGEEFTDDLVSFTDAAPNAKADQFTVTIDWGDKTPATAGDVKPDPGGGFIVEGTHAYADEGTYKVHVTITDVGGSSASADNTIGVDDGLLAALSPLIHPAEKLPFTGVVTSFTDDNPNGAPKDFRATIDWGDGTVTDGTLTFAGSSGLTAAGGGTLYAIGNGASGGPSLFSIDPNGIAHEIAPAGTGFDGGLAFDFKDVHLYAIAHDTAGGSTLYQGDTAGTFRAVQHLDAGFSGLTFDSVTDELYAVAQDASGVSTLYFLDPNSPVGVSATLPLFGLGSRPYSALTFNPADKNLYAIGAETDGSSSLYRFSLAGEVTKVAKLKAGLSGGLAANLNVSVPGTFVGIFGSANGSAKLFGISVDAGLQNSTLLPVSEVGAAFTNGLNVVGTHAYAADAAFSLTVKIKDVGGSSVAGGGTAQVTDATPVVKSAPPLRTILQDVPTGKLSLASFTFPGGLEKGPNEYSATVNWGDGSPAPGGLSIAGSVITVTGGHTYTTSGTVPVTVTLTDDTGNSTSVSLKATVEPDVTAQVHTSASGLTLNPKTNRFVGDLSITNISTTVISGPLYVVIRDLPKGVTLDSFKDVDGAGNPLHKVDQSRLSAFASLPPIALEFKNPGHVPITYTVQVFDGLRPASVESAGLIFEPNRGQASNAVSFIARGQGYAIGLSAGQVSLVLKGSADQAGAAALMQFVGANASPAGEPLDPQPGVSNYFLGGTAITGVPHFGRVRYSEVYSGIDVEYYGKGGLLENDWIVQPGANTDAIVLRFSGVDGIVKDADGNLRLRIKGGELVQRAPVAYQIVGGSRHEVAAAYEVRADGSVGFVLAAYDHSAALVIDPVLVYSTYLGGSGFDQANSVAVDVQGNTYVTGTTYSSDFFTVRPFDPQLNQPDTSPLGLSGDAFVTKFDAQGVPVYSSYLGGGASGFDPVVRETRGYSIAVDSAGHAWVAGGTLSLLFPMTFAAPPVLPISSDPKIAGGAFLTELAVDGSSILRSTVFGGPNDFFDIAVDDAGNVYAAGNSRGGVFALKFDSATNSVPYVTLLGAGVAKGISVDSSGQVYLAGFTGGGLVTKHALFPIYRTNDPSPENTSGDGFVTKLYADGRIAFSTYLGGSNNDAALDIAVDRTGVIYVVGTTDSNDLPVPGGLQTTPHGSRDAFLVKLTNDGSAVLYGTYLGGTSDDSANAVAVDAAGRAYIGGSTYSEDFAQTVKAYQPTNQGGGEGFAAALEPDGRSFKYLTYIGGSSIDSVSDVAVDSAGNATYVGVTSSPDFLTSNAVQSSLLGTDGFIVRLNAGDAGAITLHNSPLTAVEGNQFNSLVAFFSTNGSETADQFSAVIDWGDGLTSAGAIVGDFRNGFQIFGSHLYPDEATHDLFVTLRDSLGRVVTATTTGPGAGGAEGRVHYHVAIDTAALAGAQGLLSFQFNPGAIPGSPDAQVRVTSLNLVGGAGGASTIDGDASQASSTEFTLKPSTQLNRLIENVTLGSRIEFDLEFVGPGLSQSHPGNFGDMFALQLLDASGVVPLLGADSSASLLRVSVSPDGSTQAWSSSAALTVAAGGRLTVTNAPLIVALAPFTAQEGLQYNGPVATFTNGNPFESAGQFTAQIDWGDGSPVTNGVITGSHGNFTVSGSHVYQKAGSDPLEVTVIDPDGVPIRASAGRAILAALPFKNDWGQNPYSAPPVSGDFNGDGIPDVVVGGFSPAPTSTGRGVGILSGQGDGTFKLAGFQIADANVIQMAVADFNNDGKLDVAAAIFAFGETTVELFLGNGDGTLQPPTHLTSLKDPGNLVAADLRHDGKIDLLYTESTAPTQGASSNLLKVALGHGDGTFDAPTSTAIPGGFQHISIADMNGDGIPDVIVSTTNNSGVTSLEFLKGAGDGSFAAPTTFATGLSYQPALAIQDFNGDGKQDVAVVDGVNLNLFSGNGDGTFSPPRKIAASPGASIVSADFNGDGRPDLAIGLPASANDQGSVEVFINSGAGNFAAGVRYTGISAPINMLTGDFDHDGHIDIATSGTTAAISILPGIGDGTFASAVRYASGFSNPRTSIAPQGVATADVNGDSHTDAVLTMNDGTIVTELGNGDGTFHSVVSGNAGNFRSIPLLVDVNHDGRLDLVAANLNSGIGIVLGSGDGAFPTTPVDNPTGAAGATILADFNHDGRLDVASVSSDSAFGANRFVYVSLANADGTFQNRVLYPTGVIGGGDRSIAVGDFNGDGKLDLVVANESGTVSLLLGNGDGTFAAARNTVVGTFPFGNNDGIRAEAARVGDFNGDGKLDLVVVGYAGSGLFLPGNGDGTFGAPLKFTTNITSRDLAVGDFNGDGKLDLVTAEETGEQFSAREGVGGLSVLFGNGDGTFQSPVDYFAGVTPMAVTLGDFNHDGRLDIATANLNNGSAASSNVSILLGNADGTFQTGVNYTITGSSPRGIAAGDLNADGKLDLAVVNGSGDTAILLGNGDGTFQRPLNYYTSGDSLNSGASAAAIGDLNGDGRADVVAGNSLLFGKGDGTFPNHRLFTYLPPVINADVGHTSIPQDIAAGDLNGDGFIDLAVSMQGTTAILFGNGNGSFQPPIYLNPPAATGLGSTSNRVALVDMDGDGKLDVVTLNQDLVNGGGAIAIWHNNGNGNFSLLAVRHVPVPAYDFFGTGLDMAIGDLNGDGRPDVVVSDSGDANPRGTSSGGVSVMFGLGDGTLAAPIRYLLPIRQSAYRVILADVNRDGRPEIAVLTSPFGFDQLRSAVAVFTNNGDGTFGLPRIYDHGENTAAFLAAGDFNGDGAADIIVPDSSNLGSTFSIIFAGQGPALVADAPVAVTGRNINPSAGVAFTATVATFTDANPFGKASDFSATIDWGDGQTSTGSIQVGQLGGFEVTGAHTYASNGGFTTTVTVGETDAASHTGSAAANVSSADQALAASDLSFAAMAGVPFSGAVATFTDADPNGSIGDFSALINWGDGQTTFGTIIALLSGGFSVVGTHLFAQPGNLAMRVDIADIGGSTAIANSTAQVASHVHQAPLAINDNYMTSEETALVVLAAQGVLANDTDPESDPLTASPVALPAHGTLTLAADGSLTYLPAANFSGSDVFTYKANDGNADSNVATVNIVVAPVNDPPVANNDVATTNEEAKILIDVLANDSGTDGTITPATVGFTSQSLHGTISADAVTGTVTYTPQANFFGSDGFRYQVRDNNGLLSNEAIVSITVNAVNQAPLAVSDNYVTNEDTPLIVAAAQGVLVNDTDVDGNPLTASILTPPLHGTLVLDASGSFSYLPDANFFGSDGFRYVASDGLTTSPAATVSLMILPVNDPPAIAPIADQVISEGSPLSQSGSFSDPDPDDSWTAKVDYGDGTGVQALPLTGTSFSLSHNYVDNGEYVTTVNVMDQSGLSDSAAFKVTVQNLPPVVHVGVDQAVGEGALVAILGNFADPGLRDTHTATINWGDGSATQPLPIQEANGAGTFLSNHTYADENPYVVTVTVTDNKGATGTNTLTVHVSNVAPQVLAGIDRTITLGESLALPALVTIAATTADLSPRAFQVLAGSFVDPGSLDSHTATIDWGDGTIAAATVVEHSFGPTGSPSGMSGAVKGTHVYTGAGSFKVVITVTDADGAATSDSFMVAVSSPVAGVMELPRDYSEAQGALAHVITNGNDITFVDADDGSSPAAWVSSTQLYLSAFNLTVTVGAGKLTFSNGEVWYVHESLDGTLNGSGKVNMSAVRRDPTIYNYTDASGATVHLILNGSTSVAFIDGLGRMSLGHFFDSTHATVDLDPDDVATFTDDKVTWNAEDGEGGVWTMTSAPSKQITITDYTIANQNAYEIQNGTSCVLFINEHGDFALGASINATQAIVVSSGNWGNDVATFSSSRIDWSDGSVWTLPTTAAPQITVTEYTIGGRTALVIQNGTNTVVFINEKGDIALGTLSSSKQAIVASSGNWGDDVAMFNSGKINWSDGSVWTRTTTTAPQITVTEYTIGGRTARVIQNRTNTLVVINEKGDIALGTLSSPTQAIVASSGKWGDDVATFNSGKIDWSDGSVWTLATSAMPPIVVTDYTSADRTAHVIQNGTNSVVFVNEKGAVVLGNWINATQAIVPAWGNDVATFTVGQVNWSDGSVWTLTTTAAPQITFSIYTIGGRTARVIQNGTNTVVFINEKGDIALGTLSSPTQAIVASSGNWGDDVATFNSGKINWSDGSIWNLTTTAAPQITVTLTDANGAVSHAQLVTPTVLLGLDGPLSGLSGTRHNGNISWPNAPDWDNFDANALQALFEMGTEFP